MVYIFDEEFSVKGSITVTVLSTYVANMDFKVIVKVFHPFALDNWTLTSVFGTSIVLSIAMRLSKFTIHAESKSRR